MIRAFAFDLDGTLVETEELKALSYARAAAGLRPDLNEGEVLEAFKDLVGLSRQEVAVGLMRRFGLEDAARGRMVEFGVSMPWQAYVQIRLRIYETLLADPDLVARELSVEPEECLAIEDSPAGVKAALAAGAEIVAVTHRSHPPEVPRHQSLGSQPHRGRSAYAAYGGAPPYQRAWPAPGRLTEPLQSSMNLKGGSK
jgi:beta-phosphoglucomutase-like phosphatase (HAD superfamily)